MSAGLLLGTAGSALGGTWTIEPSPPRDTWSSWDTVAAGDGTAWAFGKWMRKSSDFHSQAYRRGPQGWTEVEVPDIGRVNGSTVVSRDDVWAVGDGKSIHWDGKRWVEVPVVAPPGTDTQLFGMKAFAADDVWVAGFMPQSDNSSARGTMQHWDGEKWSDVPVPDVARGWTLYGVDGTAPNDVWAVGYENRKSVALHWDGKRWTEIPVPKVDGSEKSELRDVVALAPDDVWAIGSRYSAEGTERPTAMHWDGKAWSVAKTPDVPGKLIGLTRVGDDLWAVGYDARFNPYLVRQEGDAWRKATGPDTGGTLVGGAELDDGRLLVVGTRGPSQKSAGYAAVRG